MSAMDVTIAVASFPPLRAGLSVRVRGSSFVTTTSVDAAAA